MARPMHAGMLLIVLVLSWCEGQTSVRAQMLAPAPTAAPAPAATPGIPVEVYFSPKGGCTEAAVAEINRATTNIFVQAYSFTSAPIAKALVDARQRGVQIVVILDKSQLTEKYSETDFFWNSGVTTLIDDKHAIAHNKVMVIDGQTVITGSFNFTKAAEENNAENMLIIRSQDLAYTYGANWQKHAEHSSQYQGRDATPVSSQATGRTSRGGSGSRRQP